ncbi:hypothetical protein B0T14DRAFT_441375, partial [Immersiella caudata]
VRTATKTRPSLELVTDFSTPKPKMGFKTPQLGALGVTFTVMRTCQFVVLISIIGLCANFIGEIATAERESPAELVGALTVSVTAVIYVVISYILYYDNMLPWLFTAILDGGLLIASIVVAALIGKPLSMLNCAALPAQTNASLTTTALSTGVRATAITKTLSYFTFVAVDKPTCFEIKAVWGLAISLCVLLAFSSLVCVGLWQRVRRESPSTATTKDIEG